MKRWCVLILFFCVAPVAYSQSVASLRGRVTDSSGASVSGAKSNSPLRIPARSAKLTPMLAAPTIRSTPARHLHAGCHREGFQSVRREGLDLLVATASTVDVGLSVRSVKQEVLVSGETAVTVNTSDATLGNAFDEAQVSSLPIEGRNVVELLSLQPGVTFLGKFAGNDDSDSRSGAVNGARSDQSNVTLDGVDVNDQNKGYAFNSVLRVTQDSIQEFRVTTSNPNADAGRGSGAQVTLVTKSGTNSFHGGAYEIQSQLPVHRQRLLQ